MQSTYLLQEDRYVSRLLRANQVKREMFDPTNTVHLESYRTFLTTGNWGDIQFFCEFPHVTVPSTIADKFAVYQLNKILKTE